MRWHPGYAGEAIVCLQRERYTKLMSKSRQIV
jgi:hypothetical protein